MRTAALLIPIALATLTSACGQSRETTPKAAAAAGQVKVLATVNGAPITEDDLTLRSSRGIAGAPGHDGSGDVLQTLVRDELVYQKAVQLGLDRDEEYQRRLEALDAQLRAFKRQELSARYRRHVQDSAAVSDAEARRYFEENAAFIQARLHVLQILYKGRYSEIVRDHDDVTSGMPFEEVAARRFAGLPIDGKAPWDLGELRWHQLPPAWRGVVDRLEPGQVSDIINDGERSWVVKLAGRNVDPRISFETEKEKIVEILRKQKADALYESSLAELKGTAKIVYSSAPAR